MRSIPKGMTLWVLSLTDGIKDPRNYVNVSPGTSPWVEVNGANSLAVAIGFSPSLIVIFGLGLFTLVLIVG